MKTSSGFEFKANLRILEDWRFTETVVDLEKGDEETKLYSAVKLVRLLLGEEGKEKLCKHLEEKDGTVPASKVMTEIGEMITLMRDSLKNS